LFGGRLLIKRRLIDISVEPKCSLGAKWFCMPAKSKKQQMAAGAALAAKRGKRSKSSLKGASRQMAKSMSESELRKMAKTKRKGKPTRKKRR
jgi:hypothetical protein